MNITRSYNRVEQLNPVRFIQQYFDAKLDIDAGQYKAGTIIPCILVEKMGDETFFIFRDENDNDMAAFKYREFLEELPREQYCNTEESEVGEETSGELSKEESLPFRVYVPEE